MGGRPICLLQVAPAAYPIRFGIVATPSHLDLRKDPNLTEVLTSWVFRGNRLEEISIEKRVRLHGSFPSEAEGGLLVTPALSNF